MLEDKVKYTFGLTLLRILSREEKKNFVISPLSLGVTLSMLLPGLKGETKIELLNALGTLDENALHMMYFKLFAHKGLPVKMANKILANKDCAINKDYESLLEEKYGSRIERVDFANDARTIETEVNAWVSQETDDLIRKLLPKNLIGEDSVLALLGATYFNESWIDDFTALREPLNFTLDSGERVQRDFIAKKSELFEYIESEELRFVKIPQDAGFHMLLAIPKDATKRIADVVAAMQPADFMTAVKKSRPRIRGDVVVTLPKFKIEYDFLTAQVILRELGVNKIFDPDLCNFDNLFPSVTRRPYVDRIIHKTVIDINEKGASSAGGCTDLAGCCGHRPSIIVNFDRPFCFWILSGNHIVSLVGICAEP